MSRIVIKALSRENALQQFRSQYPNAQVINMITESAPFSYTSSPLARGIGSNRNLGTYIIYF